MSPTLQPACGCRPEKASKSKPPRHIDPTCSCAPPSQTISQNHLMHMHICKHLDITAQIFAIPPADLVQLALCNRMRGKRNSPSNGEKPPLRINSKSQSWRSVSTIAGSVSASATSSFLRGASRAMRSLRTPPVVHVVSLTVPWACPASKTVKL
jgi:hypothetical protein